MPTGQTDFNTKCEILADLWLNYRDEEEWKDCIDYSDLGLPLAYMLANGIVEKSPIGENFVLEAWDLMLSTAGAPDGEYDTLDDILSRDDSVDFDKPIGAPDTSEEEDEDEEEEWEDPESDGTEFSERYLEAERSDAYSEGHKDGYVEGFNAGAKEEQERVQAVVKMNKRWAKEKNRASEYMFWNNVGEVLTPIEIDYSDEAYRKSLEDDGF
jgi:hypothetical protein